MVRKLPIAKTEAAYTTWSTQKDKVEKLSAISGYESVIHISDNKKVVASRQGRNFSGLTSTVSGRPGLTRQDYEYFRSSETVPTKHRDIMQVCQEIYERDGLIKNVIDLMGDFACQGIRISHPNKRIEQFYQNWFKSVGGKRVSERFLNTLYRLGNVVIRGRTAKLKIKNKQMLFKSFAEPDTEFKFLDIIKNEIPSSYSFTNPAIVEVIGGALAFLADDVRYAIRLPASLRQSATKIKKLDNKDVRKALLGKLPKEWRVALDSGGLVVLPPDKTSVHYYKKDDWQVWSKPIIYSILTDVFLLEKLKLADSAALDGAISSVRVWKLGSLEHKILPTQTAVGRFSDILENNVGGGTIDMVWGPDIELIESNSDSFQFLGEEKYKPTLNSIYSGLGIPPTLTGTFGSTGTTNNFISLKTLIERLQYGRDILLSFWEIEILKVQRALKFRFPATVEFSRMTLDNDDAEKALLIQLADRNLISDEALQRHFGKDPTMEKVRLNRENREREKDGRVNKAGPWYNPQLKEKLKEIALTTGVAAPSQVGLELEALKSKEKPGKLMQSPVQPSNNNKGQPQQGRPKNSKDSKKRKEKKFKPKIKAEVLRLWVTNAQAKIANIVNPQLLRLYGRKNLRSLTASEFEKSEKIRFNVLRRLEPFQNITPEIIYNCLKQGVLSDGIYQFYLEYTSNISKTYGEMLTIDEKRSIQNNIYCELYNEYSDSDSDDNNSIGDEDDGSSFNRC